MNKETEEQNNNKLTILIKTVYAKVFLINDTAQKISLGLGLGVFLGVMPITGPIASITLASLLRLNKASALLGCLMVNTWINFVTFIFAVKIGAALTKTNWQELYNNSIALFKKFHLFSFFKLSIIKLLYPVMLGYLIIGLFLGTTVYLTALVVLNKKKRNPRHN